MSKYVNRPSTQNGTDDTNIRAIFLENTSDTTYGIYKASNGILKSLSGDTAVAGNGFTGDAVRIRTANDANKGIIFENSAETLLMSINGLTGNTWIRGQLVSSIATGTAPFSVASETNVPNLNASFLDGATFASPSAIGSTTPNSGNFTTLRATQITSTVIGAAPFVISSAINVPNLNASSLNGATFASPGVIGSGVASTGNFTTLLANLVNAITGINTGYINGSNGLTIIGASSLQSITATTLTASGLLTGAGIAINSGTVTTPSISFTSDTSNDTGLYLISENNIGITTGGINRLSIGTSITSATGQSFNIGTSGTTSPLNVYGSITGTNGLTINSGISYVQAITAAGLITANFGINVPTGRTVNIGTSGTTSSLNVFGLITGTDGIILNNGSVTTPAISFNGELVRNSGIYLINEDNIGISTNGINRISISNTLTTISTAQLVVGVLTGNSDLNIGGNSSLQAITASGLITANAGLTIQNGQTLNVGTSGTTSPLNVFGLITGTNGIILNNGSTVSPAISFSGESIRNSGFYLINEDNIGICTNGINRISISNALTTITTAQTILGLITGNSGLAINGLSTLQSVNTGLITSSAGLTVNGSAPITFTNSVANSFDTKIGNMLVKTYNKLLSATVGNFTNICTITAGSGAYVIHLDVVHSEGGNSIAKSYIIANQMLGAITYYRANPISSTGSSGGNDFAVDVSPGSGNATLRLVRTANSFAITTNYTCTLRIFQSASNTVSIDDSTVVGANATNSGILASTPLTALNGKIGINTDNPNFTLDVIGTGRFTAIRTDSTLSLNGSTGASGQVLTSNGASPPTWQTPVINPVIGSILSYYQTVSQSIPNGLYTDLTLPGATLSTQSFNTTGITFSNGVFINNSIPKTILILAHISIVAYGGDNIIGSRIFLNSTLIQQHMIASAPSPYSTNFTISATIRVPAFGSISVAVLQMSGVSRNVEGSVTEATASRLSITILGI